jgi:hypothetical protein
MPGARKANLPGNCLLLGSGRKNCLPLLGCAIPISNKWLAYHRYFKPDKLAETILTVLRGVNIHHENLDHTLNYLYLRKACPAGAARN